MATYKTISGKTISNKEIVKLSPSFRKIRERISRNGIKAEGKITLQGEYGENQLSLDKYLLTNVNTIEVPNIRFITKINVDGETFLLSSSSFIRSLVKTYSNNNPYPAISSLTELIEIELDPIVERIRKLLSEERDDGVEISKNTFVNLSYTEDGEQTIEVDFNSLLSYLSWAVYKPSKNYDERILPSGELVDYRLIEFPEDTFEGFDSDEEEEDEETDEDQNGSGERGGIGQGTPSESDSDDDDSDVEDRNNRNTFIVRNPESG